jgi:hypothetical protein
LAKLPSMNSDVARSPAPPRIGSTCQVYITMVK